ncbi:flavin reductase family protein [Oceanobacillus senegalensis]|uniref:flavin reductase family protein n=1 Tax=Oceanobacillus senegalensis TaxID=1936063 RepID=UPI000A30A474|nr:flavin reductase family protein [Oceanobacillus senegalensis]
MDIDLRDLETKQAYKLMTGSVVPRPIAWVSTMDQSGNHNLAPFSFFTVASRNPPMLLISIGPGVGEREGTVKDTLSNIRQLKQFVINIVPASLGNPMQKSAENVQRETDEFSYAGLTPVQSKKVRPPRVKESPISFELELNHIMELGSDHVVIGHIVHYHIDDDYYLGNDKVNQEKLSPLGRLAGTYSEISDIFTLPRREE